MSYTYKSRMTQDILGYAYESAHARMKCHPDYADKNKKIIENCRTFKSEKDALEYAIKKMNEKRSDYQIWAKLEKDEEFYRTTDCWIATDDYRILMAAEYIGFAQVYDNSNLLYIIDDKVKIDELVD